jgi:DNA polymerase-3 subunit delta
LGAKAGRSAGVVAIVGQDPALADRALSASVQQALGGPPSGSDLESFRGDETSWARILDTCRMGSLFAARRAVVVRGAEALKGGDEPEEVLRYAEAPSPGVTLILLAGKPDRRRTLWKSLLDRAQVISAEPPKGRALRTFLQEEVRSRGLKLADEGFEELVARIGSDTGRLPGELDKLAAFAAGAVLTAKDVGAVLGRGTAPPLYVLSDAFAARRRNEVLDALESLLAEGEAPLRILATLHRSLRQIRGAMALREARVGRELVASKLQVPPFKVGDLLEASKRWTEGQYREALGALMAADRRLKSSGEPRTALVEAALRALRSRE